MNEIKNVKVKEFSIKPQALFFTDIADNDSWQNQPIKEIYKKETLELIVENDKKEE